jgi:very-short-patch-repair endonuclease
MRLLISDPLRIRPFTVAEARQSGLRWRSLQTSSWRRLSRGQYASSALEHDIALRLKAAQQRLPIQGAFSGHTAAWILGLDLPPCDPIEATVPRDMAVRSRAGMRIRRASLTDSDVISRRGFRLTNNLRTITDLGSGRNLVESVVALDMALHARLVAQADLAHYIHANRGAKGVARLRRAFALSDARAESPMETRLRLELILARLPAPELQVDLRTRSGAFIARADLYYPDVRLVIEFDGQQHKERLTADLRRQNAMLDAGYHLRRFTAADLQTRGAVAAQVRQALHMLRRDVSRDYRNKRTA